MAKSRKGVGGRPRKVKTPEELWEKFLQYKKETEANPYVREYVETHSGGKTKINKVTTPVPLSMMGLCVYLEVGEEYLRQLPPEFSGVIQKIKVVTGEQQYRYASMGVYKENIISRMLGLADRKEVQHEGEVNISTFKWGDKEVKF